MKKHPTSGVRCALKKAPKIWHFFWSHNSDHLLDSCNYWYCQTPVLVLRLGVDLVLPLSQEQQEQEQEQEQEPLTEIYQKGAC